MTVQTDTSFYIIDGSYYLYRTFFGVPPMFSNSGQQTNVVYGFLNSLHKIFYHHKPTHIAIVFDSNTRSFRHELSPMYKANRPPTPAALVEQHNILLRLLEYLGVSVCMRDGIEGDDIIGTLAMQAYNEGCSVVIATGDKDMTQLVCDRITLIDTFKNTMVNPNFVKAKYGISPSSIPDFLALMGDAADGIRGVEGVGLKTALKLLVKYQTIDNLLKNLHLETGKIQDMLSVSVESLQLDLKLTKIVCDFDLGVSCDDFKLRPSNNVELRKIYTELDFNEYYFAQFQ